MPVDAIAPALEAMQATTGAPAGRRAAVPGFLDRLDALTSSVEERTAEANAAVAKMMDKTGDVHDAMIALQRAETTFQITVQIRNKLVQAYQDVMRMPV